MVVTCWERTYRDVLAPGSMASRAAEHSYADLLTTVLVNNVEDRAAATRLAEMSGADRVVFVEDHVDRALAVTGIPTRALHRVGRFLDWPLVAATLDGPDHLLCWDAGIHLVSATDWISPSLALLEADPRVLVANPAWALPGQIDTLGSEEIERLGDFALGYGFSDQAFLTRRSDLRTSRFNTLAPASWRYPLTGVGAIFERRVDAHMRRARRLRATYLKAAYVHPAEGTGTGYPGLSRLERVRARAANTVHRAFDRPPFQHPMLRVNPDRLR